MPFVVKTDDDVLVNPFHLKKYLANELEKNAAPSDIYGRVRAKNKPMRKGKWNVTKVRRRNCPRDGPRWEGDGGPPLPLGRWRGGLHEEGGRHEGSCDGVLAKEGEREIDREINR